MSHLNTLLETKLASSDKMVADLTAELVVKQGYIEDIRREITGIHGEIDDEREKLKGLTSEFGECSKKVTKIDRAQASQQQISMASFHEARSGGDSRSMGRKNQGGGGGVELADLEKLRTRI
jgi:chromosome segregation ATPase